MLSSSDPNLTWDIVRRHQEKPWEENLQSNKQLWQEKVKSGPHLPHVDIALVLKYFKIKN